MLVKFMRSGGIATAKFPDDVDPEQISQILHIAPGAWEEITEEEERKIKKMQDILLRLDTLDKESIRPIRAIHAGTAVDLDHRNLANIEEKVVELRAEMAKL